MKTIKSIISHAVSFVFPITCSLCSTDLPRGAKQRVCPSCFEGLTKNDGLICKKCGVFLPDGGEHCYACLKDRKRFSFDTLRSPYVYQDGVRKLILKFKYSGRMFLTKEFENSLADTAVKNNFHNLTECIIPVPLNFVRRVKRGYNQAELLAFGAASKISKPVYTNVLYRKKITKPQFKLAKSARIENVKNSFLVKNIELIKNKNILLIDDVATTGATLSTCAAALKLAGAKKVFALTLARDM
ncbi:ComF family protein [Endomicrobium proavitum]|uniref:Competence protein F, component of the DNA transport apparatus n=1 Tax=Endomicrobium proavitum TaxID=1408281 RepID=A0A0G3WHU0_9BACT|nr:double zinc ribbon domain-containing protein [Endomicrobium proavitum]AKL97903.1 Competence protein F, component of the DNA transport apparatus [Endomicrobium proavitum]